LRPADSNGGDGAVRLSGLEDDLDRFGGVEHPVGLDGVIERHGMGDDAGRVEPFGLDEPEEVPAVLDRFADDGADLDLAEPVVPAGGRPMAV
jgi:hypothetical protein